MARRVNYWVCPGCSYRNERSHINCRGTARSGEPCKRTRPKKRVPKHAEVLRDTPYEEWAVFSQSVHGGQLHHCAVCGRAPIKVRRHDRDHDHRTGKARGLACVRCNRELLRNTTLEEARLVVAYLERVEVFLASKNGGHQTEGGQSEDGSSFTD